MAPLTGHARHGAGHHHHAGHRHGARGSLKLALIVTAGFFVAETVGAIYTNSLALLADAGHMLTDVAALSLSLAAEWFSTRRATPRKTYGFYRVEILAALVNGVLLVSIALYVFYEAYSRILAPPEIKAGWMLVVASLGLAANIVSAWLLYGAREHSLNIRGAFFHVIADAIGSAGAIVAGLLILWGGYTIADPLISAVVGVLILSSSWVLIRDSVDVLLEGTPSHVNIVALQNQLRDIDGVDSVHDLHVWTLTSGVLAMSCHVVVDKESFIRSAVLADVNRMVRERFRIDHTTVQIEEPSAPDAKGAFDACNCQFGAWDIPG
jgi:cobalt-zinc-cadmium efflux system protein